MLHELFVMFMDDQIWRLPTSAAPVPYDSRVSIVSRLLPSIERKISAVQYIVDVVMTVFLNHRNGM